MDKVYVVTRGNYSDYRIEKIFATRYAAEKYCAIDTNEWDKPNIEEWDVRDGSNIQIDKVYKAVECTKWKFTGKLTIGETLYGSSPFVLSYDPKPGYDYETYIVPINRGIEGYDHIKKIILDSIAKYTAERIGL